MRTWLFVLFSILTMSFASITWIRQILKTWDARFSMRELIRELRRMKSRLEASLARVRNAVSALDLEKLPRQVRLASFRFLGKRWQLWVSLSPSSTGLEGPPGPPQLPMA